MTNKLLKRGSILFALTMFLALSQSLKAQSGSTCGDPLVVTGMPFNHSGNTSSYGDDYELVDVPPLAPGAITNGTTSYGYYITGDDVVYSYTAGSNGFITINTTNDDDWVGLFAFTGCPFASTVGYHTSTSGAARSIPNLPVIAGETYYIVISTWASPQSTNYTLTITGTDIANPPTCPKPISLMASNTTSSQVDVSWMAGATETSWNLSWGPAGYTPGDTAEIGAEVVAVTNYQITNLTAETAYNVYVQADCGSGDLSFWSGPLTIYTGYCIPTTSNNSAYIENVTIEGGAGQDISNLNSGPGLTGSGYSDFSSQIVNAIPEGSIDYSIGIESGETAGLKIWIDWNNDLVFDETTELVYQSISYSGSFAGSIPLPTGAVGDLRMRIGSSYTPSTGPANACSNTGQGEYEDYTIHIITLDTCTEAIAGTVVGDTSMEVCALSTFSMAVTGNSEPADGLIRTWQSSPAGAGTWTDLDISSSTITIAGITTPTDYRYHVECTNGDTDNSEVISVSLNPNPAECYCTPEGTNSGRYIDNFTTTGGVENISNLSSGFSTGGYGDFTAMTVEGNPGDELGFTADVIGGTAGFRIWVDWNQDGAFDTTEEVVYQSVGYSAAPAGTFTIPMDVASGETRMRVVSHWLSQTGDIDPCATGFTYGEFEDYTLSVLGGGGPFPSPYCDLTNAEDIVVEEITKVDFAGTIITNDDTDSPLVDKTDIIVDITAGETYTLVVEGNTYGEFDTNIVAFIDWNQNELLDDAGEIYELGTLTNSNGNDGISVSMDILVPADAVLGTTRIRITKTYFDDLSDAIVTPCGIQFDPFGMGVEEGYGQALDFTLNIGTLGMKDFETKALSVYPVPTQDVLNIKYKSPLNVVKIYNTVGQEVFAQNVDSTELQIDLSTLNSGAYIVRLFAEEGQHSFRIVKQ